MQTNVNSKLTFLLIAAFILFTTFTYSPPIDGKIAVIVHNENPVSKLTNGETKLYWLRKIKKRWPETNKNILPVDRKTKCTEKDIFYGKVLNMSVDDVEAYFSNRQYQNAEKPQEKFSTEAEIIDFVSREIGAIGFVSLNSANDAKAKVKVVLVVE